MLHTCAALIDTTTSEESYYRTAVEATDGLVPQPEAYSAAAKLLLLAGKYKSAGEYLEDIDMHDERVIDFHLDVLNMHQEVLLSSDEGKRFIAAYYMGLGGHALLQWHKEQGGTLPSDVEKDVEQFAAFFK